MFVRYLQLLCCVPVSHCLDCVKEKETEHFKKLNDMFGEKLSRALASHGGGGGGGLGGGRGGGGGTVIVVIAVFF